jgi:tol-pal system protein YbgF
MLLRLIPGAGLALLLLSGAALARDIRPISPGETIGEPVQRVDFFGLFGNDDNEDAPVVLTQAGDPRITQLEEEIRKLSGTIEELNFQVLQMQEQMRKMQEDNEFRFQELEKGGAATGKSGAVKEPAGTDSAGGTDTATATGNPPAVGDVTASGDAPATQPNADTPPTEENGAPPMDLGALTVDENGNIKGATSGSDAGAVAALPSSDDPDELYRNAYEFILAGDYPTAEAGFRDHISRFPADPRAADAHYWLGESLLGQQKYRDAAEVFLSASKEYSSASKAPDMLLKLGVSLKALNQKDVACATFKEVGKRYPKASDALKQRLKQEQALAAC